MQNRLKKIQNKKARDRKAAEAKKAQLKQAGVDVDNPANLLEEDKDDDILFN